MTLKIKSGWKVQEYQVGQFFSSVSEGHEDGPYLLWADPRPLDEPLTPQFVEGSVLILACGQRELVEDSVEHMNAALKAGVREFTLSGISGARFRRILNTLLLRIIRA